MGYDSFELENEVGKGGVGLRVDNDLGKGKKVEYVGGYWDCYGGGGEWGLSKGIDGGWVYREEGWEGLVGKGGDVIVDLEK